MFGILKEFSVRDCFYQDVRSLVVYIELENRLGLFAFVRTACQNRFRKTNEDINNS